MCDQTQVDYKPGEVVWFKISTVWWPAQIQDQADLDEEVTRGLKKKPFAVVKFFNEDLYEFVKDINQISHYNSNRKFEFIKKGMDTYRTCGDRNKMNKFPEDIVLAEKMTGGNVNILDDPRLAPDEKINYNSLFTTPKRNDKNIKKSKNSLNRSRLSGGNSDSLNRNDNSGPNKGYFTKDLIQNHIEANVVQFKCDSCDFVCSRLTTLTTHKTFNKNNFCSNKSPIKPPKSASTLKFEKSPSKRKSMILDEPLKKKPKVSLKGSTPENKKVTKVKSMVKESKEKEKKKSEAMREQLLLDWNEEDAEDNTEEDKVDSVQNGLQDNISCKNEPDEKSKEHNEPPANKASCFDFEDNDDDDINVSPSIRFGQKLPRIIPKEDKSKSKDSKFNDKSANEDDLEKEFNNIMKETSVPVVSMMTDSFLLDSSALPDNAVAGKAEENLGTLESSSDLPEAKGTSGPLIIKPIEDEDNDSLLRTLESDSAEDEVLKVASQTHPIKRLLSTNEETNKKLKLDFAFKAITNESCNAENNNSVLLNKCFTGDGLNKPNELTSEQISEDKSSTSNLKAAEQTIEQTLAHFDNSSSCQTESSEKEIPSRKPSRRSSRRLSSAAKSDCIPERILSVQNTTEDKVTVVKKTPNKKMNSSVKEDSSKKQHDSNEECILDDVTQSGKKCSKSILHKTKPSLNIPDIKSSKNDSANVQASDDRIMDKESMNVINLNENVGKGAGKTVPHSDAENSISSTSNSKRISRRSRGFNKEGNEKVFEAENHPAQEPPAIASIRRKSLTNKKSNKNLECHPESQNLKSVDGSQADSMSIKSGNLTPTSLGKLLRSSDLEDSKKVLSSSSPSKMQSSLSSRTRSPLVRHPTKASLKEGVFLSGGSKPVDKTHRMSQEDSKSKSNEQISKKLSGSQIKQKDSLTKKESAVDAKLLQKLNNKPLKVTSEKETLVQNLTLLKSNSKKKVSLNEDSSSASSGSKHVKPNVNKELFSQDKILSPNKLKIKSSSRKKLSTSDGMTVAVSKETDNNSPSKITSTQCGSPLKSSSGFEKGSKKKIFDVSVPKSSSRTPIDKSEKPKDKAGNQSYVKSTSELKSSEKTTQQAFSEKIPAGLKSPEASAQPSSPVKSPNFKTEKFFLKSKRSSYSTSPEKTIQKPLKPIRSPNKSPFDFCVIEKTQPFSSLFSSENAFDKLTKEPACDLISHKRTSTDTSTTKKSDGSHEQKKSSKGLVSPKKSSDILEGSKRVLECSKSPSGNISPKKSTLDQDTFQSSDKSLKVESDLGKTISLDKSSKKSSSEHPLSQNKSSKEKTSVEIKYPEKDKQNLPRNLTQTKEETSSRHQRRKSSSCSSKRERSRSRSKKKENKSEKKSLDRIKNKNDNKSNSGVLKQTEDSSKKRDSSSHRKSENKNSGSHKSRRESRSRSSTEKHNEKRTKIKDPIKEGKESSSVEKNDLSGPSQMSNQKKLSSTTSVTEVRSETSIIGHLDDSVHPLITSVVSQSLTSENDFSSSPKTISSSEDNVTKEMEEIFNKTTSSDQTPTTTNLEQENDTNDLNTISQTKLTQDNSDCIKQLEEVKSENRECFTNDKVLVSKTPDQQIDECSSMKLNDIASSLHLEVNSSTPLSTEEASDLDKSELGVSPYKQDSTNDKYCTEAIIPSSTQDISNNTSNISTKSPSTQDNPDDKPVTSTLSSSTPETPNNVGVILPPFIQETCDVQSSTQDTPNEIGRVVLPSVQETPNDIGVIVQSTLESSNDIGIIPSSTHETPNDIGVMVPSAIQETPNEIGVMVPSAIQETLNDIGVMVPSAVQETPNDIGLIVPSAIQETPNDIDIMPSSTQGTPNDIDIMPSSTQAIPNDIGVVVPSSIQESPNDGKLEVCAMSPSVSIDHQSENDLEIGITIPPLTPIDSKTVVNSIIPLNDIEKNNVKFENMSSLSAERNLGTDNEYLNNVVVKPLEEVDSKDSLSVSSLIHESSDEAKTTEDMVVSTVSLETDSEYNKSDKNIDSTGGIEKEGVSIHISEEGRSIIVNTCENVTCEENNQVKPEEAAIEPLSTIHVKLDTDQTPVINNMETSDSITLHEHQRSNDIVEAQGIVQCDDSFGNIRPVKNVDEISKINSTINSSENQTNSEQAVLSIGSENAWELGPAKPESIKLSVSQDSSLKSECNLLQPVSDSVIGATHENKDGSLPAKFDHDETVNASEALLSQASIDSIESNEKDCPQQSSDNNPDGVRNEPQPCSSLNESSKSESEILLNENLLQENESECSSLPKIKIIPTNNEMALVENKTLDLPSNIQNEPLEIVKSVPLTDHDIKASESSESDLDSKLDIASEIVICTDQDQQDNLIENSTQLNQSLPKIPALIEGNLSKSIKSPVVFRCKTTDFKLKLSKPIVPTENFSPKILAADFLTPDKIKEIFKKGELSSCLTSRNVSTPLIRPIIVPPQALLDEKLDSKREIDSSSSEPSFSTPSSIVVANNSSQPFISSDVLDINSMPIVIADAPDMESKAIPVATSVPMVMQRVSVVSTSSSSQSTSSSSTVPQSVTTPSEKVMCCFIKLVKPGTVQPGQGYKIFRIPAKPKPCNEPRSRFITHSLPFVQSINSRIVQRKNSLGNKLSDFCFKKQIVILPNSTSRRVIIKSDGKDKSRIFNHILRSAPQNIQPKDLLVTIPQSEAGTSGKSRATPLTSKNIQILPKRIFIANKNKNLAGSVNLKSLQSVGLISNKKLVGICKAPDAPENSPKKVVRFLEPEVVKPLKTHVINTKKRPNIIKQSIASSSSYKLEIAGDQTLSRNLNEIVLGNDSNSVEDNSSVQPGIETIEDHSQKLPACKRIPVSKGHTDILAKALADTQVFQSDIDTSSGEQPTFEGISSYVNNSAVPIGRPVMSTSESNFSLNTLYTTGVVVQPSSLFTSEVCTISVQNPNNELGPLLQFNSPQLSSVADSGSVAAYSITSVSSLSKNISDQNSVESDSSTTKLTADINLSEIELPPGCPPENSHLTDISSIPLPPEPYAPSNTQSDPPNQFSSSQYCSNPSDNTFESSKTSDEVCLPSLFQGVSNR